MRCLRESILAHERKVIAFIAKVNSRCFLWYPAAILVYHGGTPIWRLHTELYKFPWSVSANNSRTLYRTDLRLGEVVYLLIFDNIWNSWLLLLNGFEFIFVWWKEIGDVCTQAKFWWYLGDIAVLNFAVGTKYCLLSQSRRFVLYSSRAPCSQRVTPPSWEGVSEFSYCPVRLVITFLNRKRNRKDGLKIIHNAP